MDPDRFSRTRDLGTEMPDDLQHHVRVADGGHVVHDDFLLRENGGRDHRQNRVFVSADRYISGDFRSAADDKTSHEFDSFLWFG